MDRPSPYPPGVDVETPCLRCGRVIPAGIARGLCIGCERDICDDCWEDYGTCAAPACVQLEQQFARGTPDERRRALEQMKKGPLSNDQ